MTTARNIFDKAISVIDELSDNGTVNDTQVKEYKNRAPHLIDMFQKEIARNGDLFKTFEISCFRKKNLLGDLNHYGIIIENNGESQPYSAIGANCFYLETDGDCTVTFTENGAPVSGTYIFNGGAETAFAGTFSVTVPNGTTSFLPIRGVLTTSGDNVTMTISGTYYFRHNNRALSDRKCKSALDVPDFKPWVKVTMPDDFKSRTQMINEYSPWQYEEGGNHRWEGSKDLYVLFSYEGIIRIKYIPVPAEITSLDQTLEIDDISAQAGAYYLAEHFAMADMMDDLAVTCRNKYKELKKEAMFKAPLSNSEIIDVYSIGGGD